MTLQRWPARPLRQERENPGIAAEYARDRVCDFDSDRKPASTIQPEAPRFDTIDFLRGLSIIAVVLLHTSIRMRVAGTPYRPAIPPELFHLLFRNGNNGVTVFFAISGFLITSTSIRRFGSLSQLRPAAFYRIRFARIAPLLFLVLAALSILHLTGADGFTIPPQKTTFARALFAALTFHLNWLEALRGYLPANWDVLWSLSVEEMFYLFFPVLTFLLLRSPSRRAIFPIVLLLFALAGPFARVWAFNEIWQEKSYLGGMDAIALGCLCALLTEALRKKDAKPQSWQLIALECVGALMLLLVALWPPWPLVAFLGRSGLDGTMLALGTCLIMFSTVLQNRAGGLLTAPVRWFGRHSYEVYLTHEFLIVWGMLFYAKHPVVSKPLWFVLILALSAVLGALVARYFSEPLNRKLRA